MARPAALTVVEFARDMGIDRYLAMESVYALTYRGQLVAARREATGIKGINIKYLKTIWPNEGSARAHVRKLNHTHMTEDFDYICLYKNPTTANTAVMKAAKNQIFEAN